MSGRNTQAQTRKTKCLQCLCRHKHLAYCRLGYVWGIYKGKCPRKCVYSLDHKRQVKENKGLSRAFILFIYYVYVLASTPENEVPLWFQGVGKCLKPLRFLRLRKPKAKQPVSLARRQPAETMEIVSSDRKPKQFSRLHYPDKRIMNSITCGFSFANKHFQLTLELPSCQALASPWNHWGILCRVGSAESP